MASQRSFELRQISYLRRIAELKKIELYFAWIDPTGDPKSGFGFNTIPQVKISNSQLHELDLRREQLLQTIYQNTYRIADQYNATISFLSRQTADSKGMNHDLDAVLNGAFQGDFTTQKVAAKVEEFLSNEIGLIANIASYRIVQSKVDRILLSGIYKYLLPILEESDLALSMSVQ